MKTLIMTLFLTLATQAAMAAPAFLACENPQTQLRVGINLRQSVAAVYDKSGMVLLNLKKVDTSASIPPVTLFLYEDESASLVVSFNVNNEFVTVFMRDSTGRLNVIGAARCDKEDF